MYASPLQPVESLCCRLPLELRVVLRGYQGLCLGLQVLDSALLRPGRFDRQVTVDRPDVQGRIKILQVHARGKTIGKDVDFDKISRRTPGRLSLTHQMISLSKLSVSALPCYQRWLCFHPESPLWQHMAPQRPIAKAGRPSVTRLCFVQASRAQTCRT